MRVSQNELTSLLKQAFEGLGLSQSVYEAATKALVWGQMRGLNSLHRFAERLGEYVESGTFDNFEQSKPIVSYSESIDIDVSSELLFWASSIIGLAVVEAQSKGDAQLRIHRGSDFYAMANCIADAATKGLHVRFLGWHHDSCLLLCSNPSHGSIDCKEYNMVDHGRTAGEPYAELMLSQSALPPLNSVFSENHVVFSQTPQQAEHEYVQSLDLGIEMAESFLIQLQTLAAKVLVESNERSRSGAGA